MKKAQQVKIEQPLPETNEEVKDQNDVEPALEALSQLNKLVIRNHSLLEKAKNNNLTEEEKKMFMIDENDINYEDLTKKIKSITKNLNNIFIENAQKKKKSKEKIQSNKEADT